jgi:hypothetical protein
MLRTRHLSLALDILLVVNSSSVLVPRQAAIVATVRGRVTRWQVALALIDLSGDRSPTTSHGIDINTRLVESQRVTCNVYGTFTGPSARPPSTGPATCIPNPAP